MTAKTSAVHFIDKEFEPKAREFFVHLYNQIPYYRRLFDECGVDPTQKLSTILDSLPICSSEEYQKVQEVFLNEIQQKHFLTDRTSGTTGLPKYKITTEQDDLAEASLCKHFFSQCGITSHDKILALDIDSADIYLFYARCLASMGVKDFKFGCVTSSFSTSAEKQLRFSPSVIITLPTMLLKVLPVLRRQIADGCLKNLKKIIFIGENIPTILRNELVMHLGLEVYSFFGTTEIGSMAGECESHAGIHIYNNAVIPTIIDPVISENMISGRVVWTTMHFRDAPLVKFDSCDHVTLTTARCDCGSLQPRIVKVDRTHDQFVLYGHKFRFSTFEKALEVAGYPAQFLQIATNNEGARYSLIFRLPIEMKSARNQIRKILLDTDELAYFSELGFLNFALEFIEFVPTKQRKLTRVVH